MQGMKNVVLIGFMGTGKTSSGRMLAQKLGCAFIDLDQKIEKDQGCSIPEIFATQGEAAFRALEHQAVLEVAGRRNAVISTGGGTVKDPANMEALRASGVIVCLRADVDAILERTQTRGDRPVLDGADAGDRRAAIEQLLAERASLYAEADCVVDTSTLSPLQVVEKILRYLRSRGVIHA